MAAAGRRRWRPARSGRCSGAGSAGLRRCGGEEGADATAWRHDGGCRAPHLAAVAARDGPAWQRLMPFAQLRCQSLMLLLKCGFKLAFNAPIAPVAELASNYAIHSLVGVRLPRRRCETTVKLSTATARPCRQKSQSGSVSGTEAITLRRQTQSRSAALSLVQY